MLKVVEYGKDEYEFPALLVLGCFDAIHLGHRELIKKAKLQAKINGLDIGVMMFREGKGGKLVYSFEERLQMLEQLNVKFVVAIDFTEEFKSIAPLDFLKELEDKINVKAYMSGKDFRFGAQQKGKSATLKNYAEDEENGVWYMPLKEIELDGERVSTTLIKSCIEEGNVKKAAQLLGEEFCVSGEVVRGAGRGASVVGFPTVNMVYPEWKCALKYGVYSVKSAIDGVEYGGVANFGDCPTFGDERVALEVYFENFNGDLYGKTLAIKFVDYLRDIKQFDKAEDLTNQLKTDVNAVIKTEKPAEEEKPVEKVAPVKVAPVATPEEKAEEPAEKPVTIKPAAATNVPEKVVEQPVLKDETQVKVKAEQPAVQQASENKAEPVKLSPEEKKQAFINSLEEDFDVDMSLIRALPPIDEKPVEEEKAVCESENKQTPVEMSVDYAKLDSGFDDEHEE